jgi:vitamin B12 transporter
MNLEKRYSWKSLLMFFSLLLIIATTAVAKDNQETRHMDEMVVTATRSEEKIKEIPTKIEVIGGDTIEMTMGETITEQLKKNASIGVIEYPGALAGIGIRGFRPEYSGITKHSLTLKNGRPVGASNLAAILVDNIERIEVLKGPASSLYGGEAMGGVVNIITKKNTEELTGKVEVGAGSFQTDFQKAAIGGGLGDRFDVDVYARRYAQRDDLTMGSGEKRANTSFETRNGGLRLGADLGESWRIDVSGDIYQGRDIETPGDLAYGDARPQNKDIDHYGVDATIGGGLGRNNHLSLTAYHTGETTEYYKRYSGASIVDPYRSYDSEIHWMGLQLKDEYIWSEHRFIMGIDYQNIEKESRSYNLDGSRKAPSSPDEGRENLAGYLETIWKFMGNRLTATAGGRYDTFDVETQSTPYKTDFTPNTESFATFSPRAGLSYNFNMGIRLHGTAGKAFVPPTAYELAGYSETVVSGATMVTEGNPDLEPESSLSYDIGVGYDQAQWGLFMDLTYFHTDIDDKIIEVQTGNLKTYENSLGAEISGLEAMFNFDLGALLHWQRTLALFFNATFIFNAEEEQEDGTMKDIHNVAEHTLNYGIRYNDGFFDAKLHFRNQGKMKDTDWTAAGYPELEYPTFTVMDLALGVSFLNHHRVTFKVDNLLDENYYEKKGYPKPGRCFYAGYQYAF